MNTEKQYAPHQQRVIDEKVELDVKISALHLFINGNALFVGLPEPERMRLFVQYRAMREYSDILRDRIAAFQ